MPQGSGYSPATHFHTHLHPESREAVEPEDFDFDDDAKGQELRIGRRRYNPRDDYDDFAGRLDQEEGKNICFIVKKRLFLSFKWLVESDVR